MLKKIQKTIVTMPLSQLRPHPEQDIFAELSDAELQELADDMKNNGLINAVEVLSDGTIICGHRRVAAAKLLGWTTIRCWVRTDLEDQGEDAVERRLLEDNLHRRQMGELETARVFLRYREIGNRPQSEVLDELANRSGLSVRSFQRRVRLVLATPRAVQDAYERGAVSAELAAKIAGLSDSKKQEIAARIQREKIRRR